VPDPLPEGQEPADAQPAAIEEARPYQADYELAHGVARGDAAALRTFEEMFGNRILQIALEWCRPNCVRGECRIRRWPRGGLLERILGNSCDEYSEAYTFLLHEIKGRVLRSYDGRSSLRTYLFPILHRTARRDANRQGCNYHHLFASFMASKYGKYVMPKWVSELRPGDRSVHRETVYGRGPRQIAYRLKCEADEVEESLFRIENAARSRGAETLWAWLLAREGMEVSLEQKAGQDEDGPTLGQVIPAVSEPVERSVELVQAQRLLRDAIRRLPPRDFEILELRCFRGFTGEQAAGRLKVKPKEAFEREQEAMASLHRILRQLCPTYVPMESRDLRDVLRDFRKLFRPHRPGPPEAGNRP
jgi:RNA polymerase sigma factor (sigma-70 family)